MYCGKEEKLLLRSNFSSFPQYFQYISNFKSQITYQFLKCDCSFNFFFFFFFNFAKLTCRGTDISKVVLGGTMGTKYLRESFGLRDNESRLYLTFHD